MWASAVPVGLDQRAALRLATTHAIRRRGWWTRL
jgi:hypothetical protein